MMLDWTDFPDAPAPGGKLCDQAMVPASGILSLDLAGFPVLIANFDNRLMAYVNACPHQFLPLDLRKNDILSTDGQHLMCSNHTALFRIADGVGVAGEGLGCRLSVIPTEIRDGGVFIAGQAWPGSQTLP